MADPTIGFTPYEVSYSGRVLDEINDLISRARLHGNHEPLLEAARTIAYRLRVYPQFGEPYRDSAIESAQEWVGFVPPLVVRYILYEERRFVSVVYPIKPLSRSGY
jgi:hypothetical protein